jgi:RNA polymerase sigma-70 factor (ECF subfamily)
MSKNIEELIFENQKAIKSICYVYCSRNEDREDLFQEIVYKILKSYKSFKHRSKFSTWLYRVALNTAITYNKKNSKLRMQSIDSVPVLNHFEDESLEAEIKILYKSIEKLNPVDTAIILLYLEEKSYDEISEIVGLSSKNISVKIVRIKRKLGKIYESLI